MTTDDRRPTTANGEPTFVDANILVYANVAGAPFHREALRSLTELDASGAPMWISRGDSVSTGMGRPRATRLSR
jgi:hypothetical protein